VTDYLVAFACIFVVYLLPAFWPPTWAVLVFFKLNSDLSAVPLVLGGALAAASGRLLLAHAARRARGRFSRRRLESLAAAQAALAGDRRKELGGLALFALSPVPSAQLFVAAGLLEVRLLALTAAFFAGRLVSYSLYVGGASLAKHSLEHTLTGAFSSWWGITLQVLMLAALVALVRVDWTRALRTRSAPRAPRPKPPPARSRQP